MKNWKTTLSGALLAGLVAIEPYIEVGHYKMIIHAIVVFLIAGLGFIANDPNGKS